MRTGLLFVGLMVAACALPASAAPTGNALNTIDGATLQRLVETTSRELLVPGAVVVLRTPHGAFTASYGTTQRGITAPPTADTRFRIASNTKTMTAAVIMQLAQEGKLSLSDSISKFVAGVPNGDKITIAELLEMRSGLYNFTDAPELAATIDRDPAKVWTPQELLGIAFARPPNFAPGAAYEYSNTNYVLLTLVVEKVDRTSLKQSMQHRLFGPLHLQNTEFPDSTVNTIPTPFSHGYLYGSSSIALFGEPPYTPAMQAAARAGTLQPNDYTNVNHSFAQGAGGAISSANNLATWIEALVSGRVLKTKYQKIWLDSPRPKDPRNPNSQKYGYGIEKFHWATNTLYLHGGETAGYNSEMCYDPGNHVTIVVWTNLTVAPFPKETPTANALLLAVLDRIYKVSPLTPRLNGEP
jgi:D-alanyl-D-alanine carboxypeptidase